MKSEQACALGAAMYAAVVSGLYPDITAAQEAMCSGFSDEYRPDPERGRIYDRLYARYLDTGGRSGEER